MGADFKIVLPKSGQDGTMNKANINEHHGVCPYLSYGLVCTMYLFRASLCRFFVTVCYCNCEAAV